jgi:hypothetical protein
MGSQLGFDVARSAPAQQWNFVRTIGHDIRKVTFASTFSTANRGIDRYIACAAVSKPQ